MEVDQLTKELDAIILKQEEIVNLEKSQGVEAKKQVSSQQFAAQKRKQLITAEEQELRKLAQLQKLAFDPKQIQKYNHQIAESKNRIKLLQGELGGVQRTASGVFKNISGFIAAGFSLHLVSAFTKASVNAFLEAEENANRLKFAVTAIGNEGEVAFQKLIKQSETLQAATIFSDDAIQNAQTVLATVGLTSDQIQRAIPVIADFAAATKQDIGQAAQAFTGGLQGMGREFKRFGADISGNNTALENYEELLRALSSTSGAAAEATKTLTGQLKQQENQADDLQETIGEKLAPVFVKLKVAAFDAINTIIDGFRGLDALRSDNLEGIRESLQQRVQAQLEGQKEINQLTIKENAEKELLKVGKQLNDLHAEIIKNELKHNPQRLAFLKRQNEELVKTSGILKEIIESETAREKQEAKQLTRDQLKGKSLTELNRLLKENEAANDIISQSNVDLINKEIDVRKKQTEELEKEAAKQLEALKKLYGDAQKIPPIKLKVNFDTPEVVPVNQVPDQLQNRAGSTAMVEATDATEELIKEIDAFTEAASAIQDVTLTLADAWQLYTDKRLSQIETEKNAQLSALELEQQTIEDNFDKRRISESDAARLREQLTKKQIEIQRQAAEKERAIKRKQAILDKANALIQITINTAQGISKALAQGGIFGEALAALVAAAGAAQAAIVASTPIPYRKGSKDTGAKGHMALVGEDGPEFTYMPAHSKVIPAPQTKKHAKALDAIFDNRFDEYVLKQYVTPRLIAQKRESEKETQRSFSENVARSIMVNVTGPKQKPLDGVNVTNWKQLGDYIIQGLKTDPFRR